LGVVQLLRANTGLRWARLEERTDERIDMVRASFILRLPVSRLCFSLLTSGAHVSCAICASVVVFQHYLPNHSMRSEWVQEFGCAQC
jgi:hypothetical protein